MRFAFLSLLTASVVFAQHSYTSADVEDGGRLYRANCIKCHGPDGNAIPNADLSKGTFQRGSTADQIIAIIEKGIPGTAMPANSSINDFQAATVIAYMHSFASNPALESNLVGDPARGKELFEGKGGCSGCHRIGMSGSRLGPNLSDIGANRRVAEIERAIIEPNAELSPQNRYVRVVTKDGTTVNGRLLNIDTFTIELLDSHENLRSFSRDDLRESTIITKSPMQSYKDKLSPQELADIVSYLASLKGTDNQ